MNKQPSWVMYTVQNEDDQSWGGWDDYSHHHKLDEAIEELEDLKRNGKICRVIQVTTEVVA
jgi:hypothetical protein